MGWGIEWMVMVGETTARWSHGWGGVPAVPPLALLLVVAGFLWLGLWRERWRFLGIVPILLAVPVALTAAHPDILVEPGGRTAAVRAADGHYRILNLRQNRFAAEYWLRADADPRGLDDDSVTDGVACDPAGCVARLADGRVVALGISAEALADDCRRAMVMVSRFAAPGWCDLPVAVIDRKALAIGGAHALYRLPVTPGNPAAGFRIETAFPAGPRRPFMPPLQ